MFRKTEYDVDLMKLWRNNSPLRVWWNAFIPLAIYGFVGAVFGLVGLVVLKSGLWSHFNQLDDYLLGISATYLVGGLPMVLAAMLSLLRFRIWSSFGSFIAIAFSCFITAIFTSGLIELMIAVEYDPTIKFNLEQLLTEIRRILTMSSFNILMVVVPLAFVCSLTQLFTIRILKLESP